MNKDMDNKDSRTQSNKKNNRSKSNGRHSSKGTRNWSNDREAREYAASNTCNDPSWYIPTDQTVADVASISYNNPLGIKTGNEGKYTLYYTGSNNKISIANRVPGVASIELIPTIGSAIDETSPVNIAAMNMYSAIRRANSGAKNYDAPDLIQTVLAVSSAYSALSWLMRLYGYANVYSSMNRYIPKCLVEANHVNFESILSNIQDFRARINLLVLQLNAIYVPKGMPIFDRWFHMYEKCYADSATPQAQIYQYVPSGFFRRDDTNGDLNFMALPSHSTGKLMDYEELIDYVSGLINALLYSEDVGTMSGDILKAFGEGGIYTAPMLPDNYAVVPDLSDEIRAQFENSVILGVDYLRTHIALTQNPDKTYLTSTYQISTYPQVGGNVNGKFINFHKSDVTPADTLVATRLATCYTSKRNSNNEWDVTLKYFGSEIAANCIISTYVTEAGGGQSVQHLPIFTFANVASGEFGDSSFDALKVLQDIQLISAFDWFPEVRVNVQVKNAAVTGNPITYLQYMGSAWDYDRGTYIDDYRLGLMHEAALFGEFGIPR